MKILRTRPRRLNKMQGFSLTELLITTAVLTIVMGIVIQMIVSVQNNYMTQQGLIEAQNNARAALDIMVRLTRMAGNDPDRINFQAIDPDPDNNGQLDSIHLRGDWNPADGALDDTYEDIIFSVNNGTMFKQEPGDPGPVEFLDSIGSLTFAYLDRNNAPIPNPIGTPGAIESVDIILQTNVPDSPPMEFRSSATRR